MSQPLRSSVVIVITAVLILLSVVQSGSFQASEDGPTVEDCEGHIQAAIRDFAAGSQQKDSPLRTSEKESDEVQDEHDSSQEIDTEDIIQLQHDHDQNDSPEEADDKQSDSNEDTSEEVDENTESESPGIEIVDSEETDEEEEQGVEEQQQNVNEGEDEIEGEEHDVDDAKEREFEEIKVEGTNDDDTRHEKEEHEDDDSSEAKDEVSTEETSTRDRRDAEPSETDAGQSETGDANDEEGTIESSDAADATETSDGDVGHPTTEQPEKTNEEREDEEEEDEMNHVNDVLVVAGPGELKPREKIDAILGSSESEVSDLNRERVANEILKDVKKMYENAVKPLEQLYKFKDISNRHIGDAEIFSKPMILFMGPWSTGKSAIINYLLGTEYSRSALKTGAEPTSNSFTVITYGETDQVLDGTQMAADWAFSTLQKFGQTFLDRLKGRKLSNRLLQKMTIVDTPGVIENRKSPAERQRYPLNDAFQWFIDRADLIYVVFDPSKLDVGAELEALFDQLKGRESHVRILLNKADTVKPRELMKVQGTLLWNLAPEMGTSEAPTVFVGSFWSRPYLPGSPVTLLDAQEDAFLEDLADALDSRVETKVALARRHAVRVRNHAKMVDCYLKTYYDHKSFFGNRRKVADDIVDNPHEYHIYEGLSTMTNVSRYDLPDPDVYREFFRLHPLFDFKPLASTCSYFKGCPLDKLDIVIAYDLPELVSKYQKLLSVISGRSTTSTPTSAPAPPTKGSQH